jgi:hypothetical protein
MDRVKRIDCGEALLRQAPLTRDTIERSRASRRITWQTYDQRGEKHAVRLFVVHLQERRRVSQGKHASVGCRVMGSRPNAGEESGRVIFEVEENSGEDSDREERISGGGTSSYTARISLTYSDPSES